MKKIDITNAYVFWGIIFIIILVSVFIFDKLQVSVAQDNVQSQIFERQSYDGTTNLNEINDFPDINVNLEPDKYFLFTQNNFLLVFLLIYSVALSMLFTYRERSRISKEMLEEKISIEKERIQSKVNIFDNVEIELQKYKQIISPELKLEDLDKKIDHDVNYVLFSSRVVLEKVLLSICQKHNILEETLSSMIMVLYKKRVLDPQTNGYAHTIKAFGNRVAHPNLTNPMNFSTKDALLVLSTLVALLNILESKNLIEGFENV